MSDAPKRTGGKIHHPKANESIRRAHFAAFGWADNGAQVSGKVIGPDGQVTHGCRVYLKTSKWKKAPNPLFWILYFQVGGNGVHTLQIYDDTDGHMIAESTGVVIPKMGTPPPAPKGGYGPPVITYPLASDGELPTEFAAYGTTGSVGAVTGKMDRCDDPPDTFIEQQTPPTPPTDWTLYCFISNPDPPCNLTVTQGTLSTHDDGLQF